MFEWRQVSARLVDPHDEDSPLEYTPDDIVQLASRNGRMVRINRDLWSQLDDDNKVALIFHEAIYAMIKPFVFEQNRTSYRKQSSPRAREINGYLFTEQLPAKGYLGLENKIGGELPLVKGEYENSPIKEESSAFFAYPHYALRWTNYFDIRGKQSVTALIFKADNASVVTSKVDSFCNEIFNALSLSKSKEGGELEYYFTQERIGQDFSNLAGPEGQQKTYVAWSHDQQTFNKMSVVQIKKHANNKDEIRNTIMTFLNDNKTLFEGYQ